MTMKGVKQWKKYFYERFISSSGEVKDVDTDILVKFFDTIRKKDMDELINLMPYHKEKHCDDWGCDECYEEMMENELIDRVKNIIKGYYNK